MSWATELFRSAMSGASSACGVATILFSLCACAVGSTPAWSQTSVLQQQLFERTIREPMNHEATFEYARVATANGDFEAAIGALERLLFYNQNLSRVKYELGTLYFRMGSYEMAKRYFTEALGDPNLNPVTRERIETYLPDAEKQLQQSRFSGYFNTGVRYQSNPSYAPSGGAIRLGGQDFALLPTVQRRADWNWYGILGLSHDYDFNNQRGDQFETRFVGYATHQFRVRDIDVALFDLSLGPRFAIAPDYWPGASIKPYVVGGRVWVGGSGYLATLGAGVSLNLPMTTRWTVGPEFEWRRASIDSGVLFPVTGFGSGDWYAGGFSSGVKFQEWLKLDSRALFRRGESNLVFQSFDQFTAEAALTVEFAPPFEVLSRNWSVIPFVKYIQTDFDAANPFIDPFTVRVDKQWIAGAMFNAPIAKGFGVTATVQYDKVNSNIKNYTQDNFSVMVGPTARF
jgi:hypothetical protein